MTGYRLTLEAENDLTAIWKYAAAKPEMNSFAACETFRPGIMLSITGHVKRRVPPLKSFV